MKTFLFHGPSGCGKDTQVDFLVEKFTFQKIGTGEMFRKMYECGDKDGIKAHDFWAKGLFVPNELTYSMLSKWVEQFDSTKDWAFVSVVREIGQIPLFDDILAQLGRKLDVFVHFKLTEETAIERMSLRRVCQSCEATYHEKYKPEREQGVCDKCGSVLVQREDDKPEKIKSRLEEYNRTILPILSEYRRRGILLEVDASPSIEVIHQDIIAKLNL